MIIHGMLDIPTYSAFIDTFLCKESIYPSSYYSLANEFTISELDEPIIVSNYIVSITFSTPEMIAKMALKKKLLSLRNNAIKSGMKLLTLDEILDEVEKNRGEF